MTAETSTVTSRRVKIENTHCAECGMLVEPGDAFHPWLYCWLFKGGVTNPATFLEGQHFIPDPGHWGEDAPLRQKAAIR